MKRDISSELVEGFESLAKERQQHFFVARELAPAGLRSSPILVKPVCQVNRSSPKFRRLLRPSADRTAGASSLSQPEEICCLV